jgi:uncharacterized membrane protein required for colicin V production
MALDVLALVLLAFFAWRGARRGALATGLSLFALVAGYAAAWLAATRGGDAAAALLGWPQLLAAPVAGTAAFAAVASAVGALSWLLRRSAVVAPSLASRIGGALFGVARGSLVVLALGLLSVWLDARQQLTRGGAHATDTPLRAATRAAVTTGLGAALGDTPAAHVAANALARPAESFERLRAIGAAPEIAALAADAALWAYVEAGAYDAALAQPSFQRVQWNAALRGEIAAAGLVDEASAGDPALFALEARAALAAIGPRLRALRDDPDLARLATDPAVAEFVARNDVVGLLAHPGFQRVLARALAPPAGPG